MTILDAIQAEVEHALQFRVADIIEKSKKYIQSAFSDPTKSTDEQFVSSQYEFAVARYSNAKLRLHRLRKSTDTVWDSFYTSHRHGKLNDLVRLQNLEVEVRTLRERKNAIKEHLLFLTSSPAWIKYLQRKAPRPSQHQHEQLC